MSILGLSAYMTEKGQRIKTVSGVEVIGEQLESWDGRN